MVDSAIFGARQLVDAPLDPQGNSDTFFSSHSLGIAALSRALVKFERWDDLLKEKNIPWRDITMDKVNQAYIEARAYLGKGDLDKAEKKMLDHAALKADVEKFKGGPLGEMYEIQIPELKGRLALARGDTLTGLKFLSDAAQKEFDFQRT